MIAGPVVVLAGGVGAARFLRGLVQVVPPDDLVVIGNTGDDMWWHGLYIAPDLDTVTYWLAGLADEVRGWGLRGDTFTAQSAFAGLSAESWFQLGDRDLATHLYRTGRLNAGVPLHQVTSELAERLGVRSRIVPMSDEPVETRLKTDAGDLHFQEYFVRERWRPVVHEIYWTGIEAARPAPGIAEAVSAARAILIAPSNPAISIGPILRVPGMRGLLTAARSRTVAISPLIQGRAVKGPTVELMRAEGIRPDAVGVAQLYRDIAAGFVFDAADAALAPVIASMGYRIAIRPTMLDDIGAAREVAAAALDVLRQPAAA
ncbi:MAG TPA: 2-phospho-L-lactate transferase [Candidatus Dormibacteraeota bacterium]|jgi:LPPG:FO 2-phospho-L-lactate transferase|nr:2-phospho-L-lactate transferase [Candidatus Dormibacteraeota bacterium]